MRDGTRGREFREAATGRRRGLLAEFGAFLWQSKKWWMLPILVVLLALGGLIALSGTAMAPFIYTLF
jgi:hypothetical protein